MTHQLLRARNIAALTRFQSTQFVAISAAAEHSSLMVLAGVDAVNVSLTLFFLPSPQESRTLTVSPRI